MTSRSRFPHKPCGSEVNIFDEKKFNINPHVNFYYIYNNNNIYIFVSNDIVTFLIMNICCFKRNSFIIELFFFKKKRK